MLGVDLAVVPHLVAHAAAAADLVARPRPGRVGLPPDRLGELPAAVLEAVAGRAMVGPDGRIEVVDLGVMSGRENLAQALLLRLLTPRGALKALGHETYGSRLHELIGERKTEELRALCRAYVLEAVAQEPRVKPKAVALDFDPTAELPTSFAFTLAVEPVEGGEPLGLSLEIGL